MACSAQGFRISLIGWHKAGGELARVLIVVRRRETRSADPEDLVLERFFALNNPEGASVAVRVVERQAFEGLIDRTRTKVAIAQMPITRLAAPSRATTRARSQ